ncbi:hypothetical protein Q9233_012270 [Columba guinea]|nr:hypothetical protein Q9233_012270 [Columba guinea]
MQFLVAECFGSLCFYLGLIQENPSEGTSLSGGRTNTTSKLRKLNGVRFVVTNPIDLRVSQLRLYQLSAYGIREAFPAKTASPWKGNLSGIAVGTQHGMKNQTAVREFILLGFSYGLQVQTSLYLIFLATYTVTITENAVIIFVVKRNRHLQKPMYYFLGNLSFLEICYVSVTLPRLLLGFRSQSMTISFSSCMTQLYFFISLMCTECVICDRYLAVCHPLRYPAIRTTSCVFSC